MAQPLSNLAPGSLLKLSETAGDAVTAQPFVVAAHHHHAAGRTTLVRKTLRTQDKMQYMKNYSANAYAGSIIDIWLTETYINYLDPVVAALLEPVNLQAWSWKKDDYVTISRCVFLLSAVEIGISGNSAVAQSEGTRIPYFEDNTRRIGYTEAGVAAGYWTRSPHRTDTLNAGYVSASGSLSWISWNSIMYVRPALTLPSDLQVTDVPDRDGCYRLYVPSTAAVRTAGVWQRAQPMVKVTGAWWEARPKIKVSGVWYDAG